MITRLVVATAAILGAPYAHALQQPAASPRFEVASVKINTSNDGIIVGQAQKGRYLARGFTLAALIRNAYRVQEFQVAGGPDWMHTERFDIEATYTDAPGRSEEHTSELQSQSNLVCRLLLEKKKQR